MPAEVEKPDRIEASQAGNGPLSASAREWPQNLTTGSKRSVQTSTNNSLQCRSRAELRDRACSHPEQR